MRRPFRRIKVVEAELTELQDDLCDYGLAQVLLRARGVPLTWVALDIGKPSPCSAVAPATLPTATVAICTRDRVELLAACLAAVERLDYPHFEVLVVDNAPSSQASAELVGTRFPRVRYVREPRPGLAWARNRAIAESAAEIIAFTDDDALVDPGWLQALGAAFAGDEHVVGVTGLVIPDELETRAQVLFERSGGFGRGLTPKRYQLDGRGDANVHVGPGRFGTGANMAFRRHVFDEIGCFDPALGAGTATEGGEDLEMFFRVVQEGHALRYEPSAIVRHRHRRDYAGLRAQLHSHGSAFYAFLFRSMRRYPAMRPALARFGLKWLWQRNLRRLVISFAHPRRFPRDLVIAEFAGAAVSPMRYYRARREAERVAAGGRAGEARVGRADEGGSP